MGAIECVATIADTADHAWDFRGCTDGVPVVDSPAASELQATLTNGASCTAEGVVFDGVDGYVDLDDWEWGGAFTIEAYLKFDNFRDWMKVLDFGDGSHSDNVVLGTKGGGNEIDFAVFQGGEIKSTDSSIWILGEWTHIVVGVAGTTAKVFENGVLVGSKEDGHEPPTVTRGQHWLGRSSWEWAPYFEGTVAYVRMWHGVGLEEEDVQTLYNDQMCEAGECSACTSEGTCGSYGWCALQEGGDGGGSCTAPACGLGKEPNAEEGRCDACEAGKYSSSVSAGSCTSCAGGRYSEVAGSESEDDCEECESGKTSLMGAIECVAGTTIADTADHAWDFRGCTDGVPVVDDADGSELQATLSGGAECSAEGVRLNGISSFVEIDTWEFGGALSIEMYVKHGAFNAWSKVLDFASGDPWDNVVLGNWDSSSGINWGVAHDSTWKAGVEGVGDWELGVWQHIVATVHGADMKVWKDGILVASVSHGYEPRVLTRSRHTLGKYAWAGWGYVLGEIGYLRMWHGAELAAEDVQVLYSERDAR
jgi:hypothetical protein